MNVPTPFRYSMISLHKRNHKVTLHKVKSIPMNTEATWLSRHLQLNFKADRLSITDDEVIISETEWFASGLLFQLLRSANLQKVLSPENLSGFHREYEREHEQRIDLNDLIKKQWIRFVAGDIQVAAGISRFIFALHRSETDDFVKEYEKELLFLEKLRSQTWLGSTPLVVSTKAFNNILQNHKKQFSNTPSQEKLLELKITETSSDPDQLILSQKSELWRGLKEVLAARYWMALVKDTSYPDDQERLTDWKRIFLGDHYLSGHFQELLDNSSKKRLLEACLKLITTEKDLDWSEYEVTKWWWDGDMFHHINPEHFPYRFNFKPNRHFELFLDLDEFTEVFYWTTIQSSRSCFFFFVQQILHAESGYLTDSDHVFLKTRELCRSSGTKPYLLWILSSLLQEDYPEAIPYLLLERETAAWGMRLLEKLKPANQFVSHLDQWELRRVIKQQIDKVWLLGFDLMLDCIAASRYHHPTGRDVLFDTLYISTKQRLLNEFRLLGEYRPRYKKAKKILLAKRRSDHFQIGASSWSKPYLFPFLLEELLVSILANERQIPVHDIRSIDIGRWELYFLILELGRIPASPQEIDPLRQKLLKDLTKRTITTFLDEYRRTLNEEETDVQSNFAKSASKKKIKWQGEPFALSYLNWLPFVSTLVEQNAFRSFLQAFQFEIPDRQEGKELTDANYANVVKCRIHFRILLLIHETVFSNSYLFLNDHCDAGEILGKVEEEIIELSRNNTDRLQDGVIDLFNHLYEKQAFNSYGEGLLPHLFRTAVQFKPNNRKKLLKAFLQSDLDRLLLIYNFLKIPDELELVRNIILQIDVTAFLKKLRWWDTLENALVQAANSDDPFHHQLVEELLPSFEEHLNKIRSLHPQKVILHLQIKAIQAWKQDNLAALQSLSLPTDFHFLDEYAHGFSQFKQLILGSLYHKLGQFDEAIARFEQLQNQDPQNLEIAARLYYATTSKIVSDDQISKFALEEAYRKWEQFEINWLADKKQGHLNSFTDTINYCKLVRCHYQEDNGGFDFYLEKISQAYKYNQEVLQLVTKNYNLRGQAIIAEKWLIDARAYYQSTGQDSSAWIEELRKDLYRVDIRKDLRTSFSLMTDQEPTELVSLLPTRLSGSAQTVAQYLRFIVVEAAVELLYHITIFKPDENRYNDVLAMIMRARLLAWNWQVSEQSPGGFSGNIKSRDKPGARDWIVRASGRELAVFEGLIWTLKTADEYITDHLYKLLKRYAPTLQSGFLIIYSKRKDANFEKDWEKYQAIINTIDYGGRFQKKENMAVLATPAGDQNLKIGKTVYGSATNTIEIYHLVLNLSLG